MIRRVSSSTTLIKDRDREFPSLKLKVALVLAALSLLALVPLVQATTTSSSSAPSTGSVTYSVQATLNGTSKAATVTETVTSGATAGDSIVMLAVSGTQSNFTYSHVVNSSLTLLPYLPAITNESYSYAGKNYSVVASISQHGTSQATFQGKSYTLTDYSFSATITTTNGTQNIAGTVSAFPSDLVYSVSAHGTSSSVTATLTSTTLSLTGASMSPALQATSAGVGVSLAIGAVALSLGVKFRNKPQSPGPKPDHWVD